MPLTDSLEGVAERIEAARLLDPAARRVREAAGSVLSPSARDTLSGRVIGHPLHPALVLVPAGSFISATLLDYLGGRAMRPASRRLIGIGLLSALPTAMAGVADWLDTEQAESRVGIVHAAANSVALVAYAKSWWSRHRGRSGLASATVGAGALAAGGWLGGHLSYGQGVGIDTTAFQSGPTDWSDTAAAEDVTESLRQATVDGVPLVLTRVDGTVAALADRCTHRGGPLSDGTRHGDCVSCPWHGSEFSLRTGHVVRGPASRPQPVYETRERDGRVEVRRHEQRSLRLNPVGV